MPRSLVNELRRRLGVLKNGVLRAFPPDFDPSMINTIRAVSAFTMTSHERLFALIQAVRHVVGARIPGDIVECGVWRGGSMMAVAHTLGQMRSLDRDLYLFDTFEGMSRPTDADRDYAGRSAERRFRRSQTSSDSARWCEANAADVRRNLLATGYPEGRIHLVPGKVEATIPAEAPKQIALLRLDTDWFESTRHELQHLFPRLASGGVLIVDDYGHWSGCRKAVDEYFAQFKHPVLLHRVDYTGRVLVKSP